MPSKEHKHEGRLGILALNEMTGWLQLFRTSPPVTGGCDILCAGRVPALLAAINFAAAVFSSVDEAGNELYKHIVVILMSPPSDSESDSQLKTELLTGVMDSLSQGYEALDRKLDVSAAQQSLGRIQLIIAQQSQLSAIIKVVESLPHGAAIFLANSELISARLELRDNKTPIQSSQRRLREDLWVQDVYRTTLALAKVAEQQELFILLFVQRFGPIRHENTTLLKSINNVGLVTIKLPEEDFKAEKVLLSNGSRWRQMAREQKIGEVLKEIDSQPLSPIDRALIKAQCLMTAGRPFLSFSAIEPFMDELGTKTTIQINLTTGQIARKAGEYTTSLALLRAAIRPRQLTEYELTNALDLARSLGAVEETKIIVDQLIRLYPESLPAIYERLHACRTATDFIQFANELNQVMDLEDQTHDIYFVYLLATKFGVQEIPDYKQIVINITAILPEYRTRAVLACATRALQQRLFATVIDLTLTEDWPGDTREAAAWHAVFSLEGIFVSSNSETGEPDEVLVQRCLLFILKYLEDNTVDGGIRAALYRILSPEISGSHGMAYLIKTIIEAPTPSTLTKYKPTAPLRLLSADIFEKSLETATAALPKPMLLGLGELPHIGSDISIDNFLYTVSIALQEAASGKIVDEDDLHFLNLLVHLGVLASRTARKEEEYGPKLIRIAAAGLAASGQYQQARNLVELCLQLASGSSNLHKRASWLAYADVYSRCHNSLEALIGMAITLNVGIDADDPDAWYDTVVVAARILREVKLFSFATDFLRTAREVAHQTQHPKFNLARIDYFEASIKFQMVKWSSLTDEVLVTIQELTKNVVELNRRARIDGTEVLPTALLLAQINGLVSQHNLAIDPAADQELKEALRLVSESHAKLLRGFANVEFAPDAVEVLSQNLSRTRYSEDFGTDVTTISLLARRAVKATAESGNVIRTLFLLEWLSDLSLNTIESDHLTRSNEARIAEDASRTFTEQAAQHPVFSTRELERMRELYVQADPNVRISNRYPISAELIADYVKEISKDGIDVHSIGMSDEGILIRVSAQTESVSLSVESKNVFDPEHFFSWAKRFPYGYVSFNATDLSGLNDVEKSMARIGISPTNYGRPMLLIPDVRLQSIPPNLILIGEKIAGFDSPIAVAPSMTWLKAIRSVPHVATGSRTAWIPASEPTLVTLATVLSSPLADYEFSTSLDPLPPSDMKNSDIAVIGAHGASGSKTSGSRL